MTTGTKQQLLDKLTAADKRGMAHSEAARIVPEETIGALVRKGVIVVRPVGDKEVLRVWLRDSAPVLA